MRLGYFSAEYFRKHPSMAESDRELCWELAGSGYDVRAVVEDRRVPPGGVIVERDGPVTVWRYQAPRFQPLRLRGYADKALKALFGPPRLASLLGLYARFVRENADLDLLQVEAPFPEGALVALVARRAGKPVIVSSRGWESLDFSWLRERSSRWALRRAAGVRPNSPGAERIVVERFGVDPRRVRVIRTNLSREACPPAGVNPVEFRRQGREMLRARSGLRQRFLLITAARLVPEKGLEDLLAAMRILRNRHVDAGLAILGDGILRGPLEAQAVRLGLTERVALAGSVPHAEIRELLAGADLVAIPSHLDSTPRAAVEAAAVGTPCVMTSAVGCAAGMAEAGAGRVVPPGNPEALADAMASWQADPDALAAAGQRAMEWSEGFSVERVAEEMRRFHRDVVAGYCDEENPELSGAA